MRRFLNNVLPFLVIKRRQAEIVLSFPNYIDRGWGGKVSIGRSQQEFKKQTNLWVEMKKLNGTYKHEQAGGEHGPGRKSQYIRKVIRII